MNKLINTGSEFVELKADGTFTEHKVKIFNEGVHVMRIDTDADGKETPSFVQPKVLMTIDSTTGDIIQEQRGFLIEHEILGCPTHPDTDKDYVEVAEGDIPADYMTEDATTKIKAINYKYNKTLGKLEKKGRFQGRSAT